MKLKHLISNTRTRCVALVTAGLLAGGMTASAINDDQRTKGKAEAEKIINDFTGSQLNVEVIIDLDQDNGKDKFSYSYNGTLTIHASSGVAACRGFYDFVKSNGAGICSWSANRFSMPANITKTSQPVFTSPHRDHQYFNVVTYGYSAPYWDEARWDKELNWMAMHGIDMPLMLVGAEGIYFDTFTQDFGIPAADVHAWEVGPAHLPWMRMGNLAGSQFDGPLDQHWYDQQKKLAHHILERMYALGMKPICPAFGGFVPATFAQHNPGSSLTNTGWDWVINRGEYNQRLNPDSDHFKNVGKKFIERWEAEFSKSYPGLKYYLSDSFNEMTVPTSTDVLSTYGNNIYASIRDAATTNNPGADRVWVTQGWEFIYGNGKWRKSGTAQFKALTNGVPANNFMVLSMSPEYGGYGNKGWEWYDNYNGKDWINTMLPNMGGKNFWTGCLNDYANTFPKALAASTGRSNCTGWGMTMEGIEYNELLYELIADMGWTDPSQGRNVDEWVTQYGNARYADYNDALKAVHTTLRNNVYRSYKDHQTFGWQGYNRSSGYYTAGNIDYLTDSFFTGIESFFSAENIEAFKAMPNVDKTLRADLIELAAFYASARVEKICQRIVTAKNLGDTETINSLMKNLEKVMLDMDRALTGHPLYDLQKWEDKAYKAAGDNVNLQRQYVRDARSIVSTWHSAHGSGPNAHEAVNDYAGRIWAGLVRGYYWPRLKADLENFAFNRGNNLRTIENAFVNTSVTTDLPAVQGVDASGNVVNVAAFDDNTTNEELFDFLRQLVVEAHDAGDVQVEKSVLEPSTDAESHWYAVHSNNPAALDKVFTAGTTNAKSGSFDLVNLNGASTQLWRFVDNGDNTYRLESRDGQNLAYDGGFKTSKYNLYTDLTYEYDEANGRYAIHLANAGNTSGNTWMHYNNTLQLYGYKGSDGYYAGSTYTLQNVDARVQDVSVQADYNRLRARLTGYKTWSTLYGAAGQPKSEEALADFTKAVKVRDEYNALQTYPQFLQLWDEKLNEYFNVPSGVQARKLFNLMLGAMDVPNSSSASATTTFRNALTAAQQAIASGNESSCQQQIPVLQAALKAYLASAPNFPYVSPAPQGGKFVEGSTVITLKCNDGGGYITTTEMQEEAFRLTSTAKPSTTAGYWVVSGDDTNGYSFYNVGAGASKVLGFTGSEGSARAKLYDAATVDSQIGVTYKFKYTTNSSGAAVFFTGANNAWNNFAKNGWLALWNNASTLTTNPGSAFTIETVENVDLGPTAGGGDQSGYAEGTTATITAVFPDGTKHAVYSDGTKLTAGETVPENGISTFSVAGGNKETGAIVLKAGDKYLHMACGDDDGGRKKMNDPDGLSESTNDWTTLTLEKASATGVYLDKRNGSTTVTGQWDAPSSELYQIKGMCSDNSYHYFILRSNDNWIGANSNDRFYDSNWNGDGTLRTSFFEVTITEPEPEVPVEDLIPSLTGYKVLAPISERAQLTSGKYFVSVYSKNKEGLLYGNEYKNVSTETAVIDKELGDAYVWTITVADDGTFTLTNSQGKVLSVQGARDLGKHNVMYTDEDGTYEAASFSFNPAVVNINGVNHWMIHQQYQMADAKNATDDQKLAYLHCNCDNPGLTGSHLRLSYWEGYNNALDASCDKFAFYPAKAVYDDDATISALVQIIAKAIQGKATQQDINRLRNIILEIQ